MSDSLGALIYGDIGVTYGQTKNVKMTGNSRLQLGNCVLVKNKFIRGIFVFVINMNISGIYVSYGEL